MGACPSRSEAVRSLCPGRRPRAGRCRPGGVRSLPNERSGLWEPLEARALPGGGSRDQRLSICRDGLRGAAPRSLPPRPAEPPTSPVRARTSISSEGRVLAAWPPSPGLGTPGTEQLPVICTLEDSLTPAERRMRNSANTSASGTSATSSSTPPSTSSSTPSMKSPAATYALLSAAPTATTTDQYAKGLSAGPAAAEGWSLPTAAACR